MKRSMVVIMESQIKKYSVRRRNMNWNNGKSFVEIIKCQNRKWMILIYFIREWWVMMMILNKPEKIRMRLMKWIIDKISSNRKSNWNRRLLSRKYILKGLWLMSSNHSKRQLKKTYLIIMIRLWRIWRKKTLIGHLKRFRMILIHYWIIMMVIRGILKKTLIDMMIWKTMNSVISSKIGSSDLCYITISIILLLLLFVLFKLDHNYSY